MTDSAAPSTATATATGTVSPAATDTDSSWKCKLVFCTGHEPLSSQCTVCPHCSIPRDQPFRITTGMIPRWTVDPKFTETLTAALSDCIPLPPLIALIRSYVVIDRWELFDVVGVYDHTNILNAGVILRASSAEDEKRELLTGPKITARELSDPTTTDSLQINAYYFVRFLYWDEKWSITVSGNRILPLTPKQLPPHVRESVSPFDTVVYDSLPLFH